MKVDRQYKTRAEIVAEVLALKRAYSEAGGTGRLTDEQLAAQSACSIQIYVLQAALSMLDMSEEITPKYMYARVCPLAGRLREAALEACDWTLGESDDEHLTKQPDGKEKK